VETFSYNCGGYVISNYICLSVTYTIVFFAKLLVCPLPTLFFMVIKRSDRQAVVVVV